MSDITQLQGLVRIMGIIGTPASLIAFVVLVLYVLKHLRSTSDANAKRFADKDSQLNLLITNHLAHSDEVLNGVREALVSNTSTLDKLAAIITTRGQA
jgi:hypothetical protein